MAFLMSILGGIGQWLLRAMLGGIVGKIENAAEEAAKSQRDAALLQAQTIGDGKDVELNIVKAQDAAKAQMEKDAQARPIDDPFGVNAWNSKGAAK